jgi:hypothetical protein
VTGEALIESHHNMHYMDFNAILKTPTTKAVAPYAIGGFGMYYRTVSLTTPAVGFTTWRDPYWYVCYPTAVPVDQIKASAPEGRVILRRDSHPLLDDNSLRRVR